MNQESPELFLRLSSVKCLYKAKRDEQHITYLYTNDTKDSKQDVIYLLPLLQTFLEAQYLQISICTTVYTVDIEADLEEDRIPNRDLPGICPKHGGAHGWKALLHLGSEAFSFDRSPRDVGCFKPKLW